MERSSFGAVLSISSAFSLFSLSLLDRWFIKQPHLLGRIYMGAMGRENACLLRRTGLELDLGL